MKWFGRGSGRDQSRPALGQGRTGRFSDWPSGDWPMGYEAQVRAAYLDNPVAQRAVRLVAEGIAAARSSPAIRVSARWSRHDRAGRN